jgi:C4-dicarboxylate-specific signal transduction histidine kinase
MSAVDTDGAAFIARVTASATHEIRNVLAIVRESAGLIDDLVRSSPGGDAPIRERMVRALERVDAQVARGAEIVATLNRFAHGLERTEGTLDLAEEVPHAVCLCRRSAAQRRHTLEARPGDAALPVRVAALPLQMALEAAFGCCLDRLPAPGTVSVRAVRAGDGAAVECAAEAGAAAVAPQPATTEGWRRLATLAEAAGASVEADACGVRLLWPRGRGA